MIILEDGSVSELMQCYLEDSGQPVMATKRARALVDAGRHLTLVDPEEAMARVNAGERLYTMAETHLGWIRAHLTRPDMADAIKVFKDKQLMRERLAPLYPDFRYRSVTAEELLSMPCPVHELPCIVKPSVGFLSAGVYPVRSRADWDHAVASIRRQSLEWASRYDETVVDWGRFLIESLIEGEEYAIDAWYDDAGEAQITDILHHEFAGPQDSSDRLYTTGPQIIRTQLEPMTRFLNEANRYVGARCFPVHVEVRVADGCVYPIEFNPLRFAGMGGTEVSWYAYGHLGFDAFLNDRRIDWDSALARCGDDDLYCLTCLNPEEGTPSSEALDYSAVAKLFSTVLSFTPFELASSGFFGFMFWKTSARDSTERQRLLNLDLSPYLHPAS
ncbi:MAG: ATP-grasp domain-containing protein [Eggerthellaceae bacterium]|jgi:hypothetical protein